MARMVKCGLIQASNPVNDPDASVAEIQKAMLEKHLPMIDDAGKQGVQILGDFALHQPHEDALEDEGNAPETLTRRLEFLAQQLGNAGEGVDILDYEQREPEIT